MSPSETGGTRPSKRYLRWTLNERVQHWTLAVTFLLLVITGFALKYPEAWWVRPFLGVEWQFNLRGLLHRVAGTVFLALGVYHISYMLGTRRGRELRAAFRPRPQDLRDLVHNVSYNLGLRRQRPAFAHFTYMEKVEYLALIWGAVIMGVSGLMLWFEEVTLLLFPKWVLDLVTVIHLYEAWLASLAILVWHFYYVILNPDVYPLNTSMIDGMISEEALREEHFLEWQALQSGEKQQTSESNKAQKRQAIGKIGAAHGRPSD